MNKSGLYESIQRFLFNSLSIPVKFRFHHFCDQYTCVPFKAITYASLKLATFYSFIPKPKHIHENQSMDPLLNVRRKPQNDCHFLMGCEFVWFPICHFMHIFPCIYISVTSHLILIKFSIFSCTSKKHP